MAEIPFDYRLRYHAALHQLEDKKMLSVVGAPETVLAVSEKIWKNGKSFQLEKEVGCMWTQTALDTSSTPRRCT